jgi:hypothetical protein
MSAATYPMHVDARLDAPLNRWLWLVKWLLAIPHFVVLVFLWIAYAVLTIVAFFAILFTGRYPRAIFEFNLGVMRWSWRVCYYSYGALGTDRYPPFTLDEVPDYPTHLAIAYPERLSRGLVLVKWLLGIPHYLIVGLFVGGGAWFAWQIDSGEIWSAPRGGGLVGLLVLIAAVVLLFTGRYPQALYDFVLGLNRWVLRVAAYAGLMTDAYPPFRLDLGGPDPDGVLTMGTGPFAPPPATPPSPPPPPAQPAPAYTPYSPGPSRSAWGVGRIIAVIVGAIMVLVASGLLIGGGVVLWADQTQRTDGYLTSGDVSLDTTTHAIATDRIELGAAPGDWTPARILGTVRFRVTPDNAKPVFVGIARESDAKAYLAGTGYDTVRDFPDGRAHYTRHDGAPPSSPPTAAGIWKASASGPGTQTVVWKPTSGHWMVVVMNADGSSDIRVQADAGATIPSLGWIAGGLLIGGGVLLIGGATVIIVAVATARPKQTVVLPPTASPPTWAP